ncbi:hypothetical protein BJ322DRAFT_799601 [Thelephora terrestris]|uniref:F-box domain-containing protein n=1 Tax=Thelephora terrestris TaxID=56493 RepID=A0A9P6HDY0_9AGAM|nr:hypothetical protein BJ322DRAFT_799601 [Thelephora terrestris]
MDREIGIDPILISDKQIAEREAELIQLKRSQNSLLSVARIPPEILGRIFQMNLIPRVPWEEDCFATIQTNPYNFLLVCHHWYEVARHTPELWSCWGDNLVDWKRRCLRFENSPVDLVLDGAMTLPGGTFDETIRGALKSRASRDLVRKVHFRRTDKAIEASIISLLTPENDFVRHSSIESIILTGVDVADFFARHYFPKLRYLSLNGCSGFALEHLKSHTKALVNFRLSHEMISRQSIPTTSQILSLLTANPYLQTIALDLIEIDDDVRSGHGFRAPLRHLKRVSFGMDFRCALTILQRLEFSNEMDHLDVCFDDCTLEAGQSIGPYIRDCLEDDARSKSRLAISVMSNCAGVSLEASVAGVGDRHTNRPQNLGPPYAEFLMMLPRTNIEEDNRVCIDLLTLLPQERITYLLTDISTGSMEELLVDAPNVEVLRLIDAVILEWFLLPDPSGPNAHRKLLPSLRWLVLEGVKVEEDDWDPLVRYLAHQASGEQSFSLSLSGKGVHICSNVQEQIRGLVDLFLYYPDLNKDCPFNYCSD